MPYEDNAGAKLKRMVLNYSSARHAARTLRNGKIANNTWIFERPDPDIPGATAVMIILHNTPIVTYHEDESVTLNSGGYQTVTTKTRMNDVVPSWIHVQQLRGQWFVHVGSFREKFYDGIRLYKEGEPVGHRRNPTALANPRAPEFTNDPADIDWLFDVHLDHEFTRHLRNETKSYVLYGNADSPDAVILYTVEEPSMNQRGMKVRFVDGEIESVSSARGHL